MMCVSAMDHAPSVRRSTAESPMQHTCSPARPRSLPTMPALVAVLLSTELSTDLMLPYAAVMRPARWCGECMRMYVHVCTHSGEGVVACVRYLLCCVWFVCSCIEGRLLRTKG